MKCFRDKSHPVFMFMVNLSFTRDHQMVNTNNGRFGFSCTGVQPGDVVCVFNDSVSPFVVRRVDEVEGRARWKLVGDAYVHGLMHGEADISKMEEEDILLM